ncbi:MAG: hypothetical protein HPKKFMNG_00788 [Planctomycetes bacterium]|nr:hypothetical protein [Planctomycetota bacterium]HRJ78398.1 hypothetical protein [Planctomycetota bacterium]
MSRLAGLAMLLCCLGVMARAQDAQPEVVDLIARLADDRWEVRERAQRRLVAIGEPAREKLRQALLHDDPEVRARSSAALISLGETFTFALNCSQSDKPGQREHGRNALQNLFGLEEGKALSVITPEELSRANYGRRASYSASQPLSCPPPLAIATLEALSGFPILVSAGAAPRWQTAMQASTVSLDLSQDYTQPQHAIQHLRNLLARTLGAEFSRDGTLEICPLRVGQLTLLFVCTQAEIPGAVNHCASRLIAQFVQGGLPSGEVARVLAAAVSLDPTRLSRLAEEAGKATCAPELVYVALCSELNDDERRSLAKLSSQQVRALMGSRLWSCLRVAVMALLAMEASQRAPLLNEVIVGSTDSMELLAALWCARGLDLTPEARSRVSRCVTNSQDGIAAAAVRWYSGAPQISDEDLKLAWKSAEVLPVSSAFFSAALQLFTREDIRPRLLASAREALSGRFDTQQALAAAVLKGQAGKEDLARVLERLNTAQDPVLGGRLIALFEGCSELTDAAVERLAGGMLETDAQKRRRLARVMRLCDRALLKRILDVAETRLAATEEKFGGKEKAAGIAHIMAARMSLLGFRAGLGEVVALETLMEALKTASGNALREASSALVDALDEAGLSSTLAALKKAAPARFIEIATGAYLEQCRRAVEQGNREAFRMASARVNAVQTDRWNWQLQDQLAQLESMLDAMEGGARRSELLPSNPFLKSLKVE